MTKHDHRPEQDWWEHEQSKRHLLERIADAAERQATAQEELVTTVKTELHGIWRALNCICDALQQPEKIKLKDFRLVQLGKGDTPMSDIIGVRVGGKAAFEILPVPGQAVVGSGPTATSATPGVTVGPNPNDPANPYMIEIAVADGTTGTSLDLKVDGTDDSVPPLPVTHTFTIPIQAGPAPKLVDWDLSQLVAQPIRRK